MNSIGCCLWMFWQLALRQTLQELWEPLLVNCFCVSTFFLPDIATHDRFFQAFPPLYLHAASVQRLMVGIVWEWRCSHPSCRLVTVVSFGDCVVLFVSQVKRRHSWRGGETPRTPSARSSRKSWKQAERHYSRSLSLAEAASKLLKLLTIRRLRLDATFYIIMHALHLGIYSA